MLVVATDAPLDARDLRRLAARAIFGLARTGSSYTQRQRRLRDRLLDVARDAQPASTRPAARAHTILPTEATSPLFEAALEATEEAVYNALFQATDGPIGHRHGAKRSRSSADAASCCRQDDHLSRLHRARRSAAACWPAGRSARGCQRHGHEVLTTHLLADNVETAESAAHRARRLPRDLAWLTACDVLVAEASGSSYGVGFEVGYVPRARGRRAASAWCCSSTTSRRPRQGLAR